MPFGITMKPLYNVFQGTERFKRYREVTLDGGRRLNRETSFVKAFIMLI